MGLLVTVPAGCSVSYRPPQPDRPGSVNERRPPEDPRATASLQLTRQGRELLESGRPDDAISMLERAVGIGPTNGQNYYYLAEAWIQKGDPAQAEEFNRLAAIYLEADPEWMARVEEQRLRIEEVRPPEF